MCVSFLLMVEDQQTKDADPAKEEDKAEENRDINVGERLIVIEGRFEKDLHGHRLARWRGNESHVITELIRHNGLQ